MLHLKKKLLNEPFLVNLINQIKCNWKYLGQEYTIMYCHF